MEGLMILNFLKCIMIAAPAGVIAGVGTALVSAGAPLIGLSLAIPAVFWGLIFINKVAE